MSVAAAALALSRPFPFDGEELELHPLTFEDLARFSLWMEERARRAAIRSVNAGEDAKAIYSAFLANVAACVYEPGSEHFDAAARSPAGSRKILALMLREGGTEDMSWRVYADEEKFAEVTALMQQVNSDPKARALRRTPTPAKPKTPTQAPPGSDLNP